MVCPLVGDGTKEPKVVWETFVDSYPQAAYRRGAEAFAGLRARAWARVAAT